MDEENSALEISAARQNYRCASVKRRKTEGVSNKGRKKGKINMLRL